MAILHAVIGSDDILPSSSAKISVPNMTGMEGIKEFVAGLASGCVGAVLCHPLDSARVVAQNNLRQSLLENIQILYQNGLMRGLGASVATQGVGYCLVFGCQARIQDALCGSRPGVSSRDGPRGAVPLAATALSGSLTGILVAPLTCALETLKCRRQMGLDTSWRSTPFFRGLAATTIRCGLGNSFYFAAIELGRRWEWSDPVIGAASGVAYWILACPFDLIKNRQQVAVGTAPTMVEVAKQVLRSSQGSPRGLWRGMGTAVVRTVPMQAIVVTCYATLMQKMA